MKRLIIRWALKETLSTLIYASKRKIRIPRIIVHLCANLHPRASFIWFMAVGTGETSTNLVLVAVI